MCDLPWKNPLDMLVDSTVLMREEKSGLEVCIRGLNLHLFDTDRDLCYHMDNILKISPCILVAFFERLCNLYTDFKHSTNSHESLKYLTFYLNVTFRKPSNYLKARWFAILDSTFSFPYMTDSYIIYYNYVQVLHKVQ